MARTAPRAAFERLQSFLTACAQVDDLYYRISSSRQAGIPPPPGLRQAVEQLFPPDSGDCFWIHTVPSERIDEALDLFGRIRPEIVDPKGHGFSFYWLQFGARFRVLAPDTRAVLPGQEPDRFHGQQYGGHTPLGASDILVSVFERTSLSINLCVPEDACVDAHEVVVWLQEHLPVRFSPKHWKRWKLTKTGTYSDRHIPPP
jgi:hypothetical protein